MTEEHSKKIESLLTTKTFTIQDVACLLDNLYTENQIRYHVKKYYPHLKNNFVKEYSKGGTKLEYILKELFPYDKIASEFPLGEKLRVDFVVTAPYNLAFEFDGIQHSEYSSFFHGSKGAFNESVYRDNRKEVLLANRGLNLIRISSLEIDRQIVESLIETVGYGSGIVQDESLLTVAERKEKQNKQLLEKLKEKVKKVQVTPKQIETDSSKAYKESLKQKQKEYRKQQYEKQKQWLKENKKKKS